MVATETKQTKTLLTPVLFYEQINGKKQFVVVLLGFEQSVLFLMLFPVSCFCTHMLFDLHWFLYFNYYSSLLQLPTPCTIWIETHSGITFMT